MMCLFNMKLIRSVSDSSAGYMQGKWNQTGVTRCGTEGYLRGGTLLSTRANRPTSSDRRALNRSAAPAAQCTHSLSTPLA